MSTVIVIVAVTLLALLVCGGVAHAADLMCTEQLSATAEYADLLKQNQELLQKEIAALRARIIDLEKKLAEAKK